MTLLTDLFTDLEVLSMVKENDKLCIRDGHITIEYNSHPYKIAVRRWYNNDNRRHMIMEINKIITTSIHECNECCKNIDCKNKWTIEQFSKHFKNIIHGLDHLKKTYFNDSSIIARLNVLKDIILQEIIIIDNMLT